MHKILLRSYVIILILALGAVGLAQDVSFEVELTPDGENYTGSRVITLDTGQTVEVRLVFFDDVPDDAAYTHTFVGEDITFRIENTSSYFFTSSTEGEFTITAKSPVEGELRAEVFDNFYDDDSNPLDIMSSLDETLTSETISENTTLVLSEIDLDAFAALFEVDLNPAREVDNHTLRLESLSDTEELILISETDDILEIRAFDALVLALSPRSQGTFIGYILNSETADFEVAIIEEPSVAGLAPINPDDNNTGSLPPLPGAGGAPALSLAYGDTGFTVTNVSGDIVDLNNIIFVGEIGELHIERWIQYLSTSLDNIREGRCLQVYTFGAALPPQPPECDSALAWFSTGSQAEWFWLGDFSVMRDGEELGTCPPAPDTCMIRLP